MGLSFKHIKKYLVDLFIFLFILLFVYAAVSKLVDYETFENQLGQSPLLSAFAGWVAPGVIIIELLIALLLIFERTRLFALFGFYSMMVLFTTYIIIILNFTDFIPCSCGGVLEQLGWTEHLVFNVGFMGLAVVGIIVENKRMRLLRFAHLR
ncbi:MauE/DoxX family redox-associated membrane protein [uncultured Planktosalinus sp.]|uniref:MauE/DoxX family redox-associated membrane protein n=1 Tax=uncultured Planktosalinus sp. TaxID=1810935 RepID=UPI0030D8F03D